MSHDQTTDGSRRQRLQEKLTQPTIRVVLALIILYVIRALLVRIPGTSAVIYEPNASLDITVATVLYTAVTLVIFGAIIRYASTVGAILAGVYDKFPEIERVVQLIGALVVLAWAYQLFDWIPYFEANPTQYDYVFLLLGIGFGGWLGYILYTNVDKFSEHISSRSFEDGAATTDEPDTRGTSTITCPKCDTEAPRDADFCSTCGASLTDQQNQANHIADQL